MNGERGRNKKKFWMSGSKMKQIMIRVHEDVWRLLTAMKRIGESHNDTIRRILTEKNIEIPPIVIGEKTTVKENDVKVLPTLSLGMINQIKEFAKKYEYTQVETLEGILFGIMKKRNLDEETAFGIFSKSYNKTRKERSL